MRIRVFGVFLVVLLLALVACSEDTGAKPDNLTDDGVVVPESMIKDYTGEARNLSGSRGNRKYYTLNVPEGASNLSIRIFGGSGDADLYVRYGATASTTRWDCRPYRWGNSETCTFDDPRAGTYSIMVRAYSSYSGVTLRATYDDPAPAPTPDPSDPSDASDPSDPTDGSDPTSPNPPASNFDIQFVFGPNVTAAQRTLFQNAAARWEEVIVGDLPDTTLNKGSGACGQGEPAYTGAVDDVVIYAEVGPRDGPGGILASAGPCYIRGSSQGGLTTYGVMNFDSADSNGPELFETILHEMGHVLGVGTLWTRFNLVNYSSGCPTTPRYTGNSAKAEWLAFGGSGDVPVEEGGGGGTRCGHWDEETFNNELMTGYSEGSAFEPLSRMTAGTLEDMGYGVNKNAADSYSLPNSSVTGQAIDFERGEILLTPVGINNPDGSVTLIENETE